MPKGLRNSKQFSVSWNTVGNILAVIFGVLAISIAVAFGARLLFFFLLWLLFTGTTELPLLILCAPLIIVAIVIWHKTAKHARPLIRFALLGCACIGGFYASVLLAILLLPLFQYYRVVTVVPKMDKYLEERYGTEFMVDKASSCQAGKYGSKSYVCATAYPTNNSGIKFSVKEDYNGKFVDSFKTESRKQNSS